MLMTADVILNFDNVLQRVKSAATRSGQDPKQIELLAVTKYADNRNLLTLLKANKLTSIAETRVQDAIIRWNSADFLPYKNKVKKHFIGRLQSNKIKKAVEFFDFVDSLDNIKTAEIVSEKALQINKKVSVMVQIKLTDKQTQSGIEPTKASALVKEIKKMENLLCCGYMAIAPTAKNPEVLRPLFKQVKKLFDKDFSSVSTGKFKNYLSLGMSGDFETAMEEGSNLPRIGSAIFD